MRRASPTVVGTLAVSFLLTLAWACPAPAQNAAPAAAPKADAAAASKADPRVNSVLLKIGYKSVVTPLGNYLLDFQLPDKRGQLVYISSRTEKFEGYETRKIWAYVYKSKDLLSAEMANQFLMDNVPQKAGAYELSKSPEGGYEVVYTVKVDADAGPKPLRAAIRLVMLTADAKELELTKKDEF